MTIRALILAAGLGTRLRPLTDRLAKCLVPIGPRPLLEYWLIGLGDAGVRTARVNTHAHHEQVAAYLQDVNDRRGMLVHESYEPELLGSAGTVTANRDLADDADCVIIIYADNLSQVDLRAMCEYHTSHDQPVTMLLFHASNPKACGIAEMNDAGRIIDFVEKPDEPKSDLANAGVYIMDADAYREAADLGAFDLGFEVLPRFIGRMNGFVIDGYHRDVGTLEAYEQAQRDAAGLYESWNWSSDGRRPAVFLDRDGTIIQNVHYLSDPAGVQVMDGVAEAICDLRRAGYCPVVVTNQAAIAKGVIDEARHHEINETMCRQLAERGAVLDALYFCAVKGEGADRLTVEHEHRKPGPGMLKQAANELSLDMARSWMVGDMASDVMAGQNAGVYGSILLESGMIWREDEYRIKDSCITAVNLREAANVILAQQPALTKD